MKGNEICDFVKKHAWDKVREIDKRTKSTGFEHGFVIWSDGKSSDTCVGNECELIMQKQPNSEKIIGSIHTHPGVSHKMIDTLIRRRYSSSVVTRSERFLDTDLEKLHNRVHSIPNAGDLYFSKYHKEEFTCVIAENYLSCLPVNDEIIDSVEALPDDLEIDNPTERDMWEIIDARIRAVTDLGGCRIKL